MAFAIIYDERENRHPYSHEFHSDDPMKDFRGNNAATPQSKWKIINVDIGEIDTKPIVLSLQRSAGNKYVGKEIATRSISLSFDVIIDNLFSLDMHEQMIEQTFETEYPFMFYRDLRKKDQRFKDVPPNTMGFRVMKTELEIEIMSPYRIRVNVGLETVGLPYRTSYGSTKDIIESGNEITPENPTFGWNNMLPVDPKDHQYKQTVKHMQVFNIYNPSLFKVRHYEACTHIKIYGLQNIVGSSLTLVNTTNGTNINIDTDLAKNDTIEQKDNIVYINGYNEMAKTNWRFIELEKGDNVFELQGADATVEFIFKFYQ